VSLEGYVQFMQEVGRVPAVVVREPNHFTLNMLKPNVQSPAESRRSRGDSSYGNVSRVGYDGALNPIILALVNNHHLEVPEPLSCQGPEKSLQLH
jgi:hypothetical protein